LTRRLARGEADPVSNVGTRFGRLDMRLAALTLATTVGASLAASGATRAASVSPRRTIARVGRRPDPERRRRRNSTGFEQGQALKSASIEIPVS
jgi:hypothetical protein